jgi:hypothetical protein
MFIGREEDAQAYGRASVRDNRVYFLREVDACERRDPVDTSMVTSETCDSVLSDDDVDEDVSALRASPASPLRRDATTMDRDFVDSVRLA